MFYNALNLLDCVWYALFQKANLLAWVGRSGYHAPIMLLHKVKQQLLILNAKGFKAPRLIPVTILSMVMSMGAVAGHSAIIQDFALGHNGQDAQARADVASTETKPTKTTRSMVRGMQNQPQAADDAKPVVRILDSEDEKTYRDLFAAMYDGKLKDAEALAGDIKDGTLLGTAQALFLLNPRNPNLKYSELAEWLKAYGDLPQAHDVYKKALSLRTTGDDVLPAPPAKPAALSKSQKPKMAETLEWKKPRGFTADALWRAGKFTEVVEALPDTDVSEQAAAESYYPLWIKGLALFAVEDYAAAAHSFIKITKSGLPAVNRAAASYWAGRAFEKTLQHEQATLYFEQAALHPHSYYGLLALARKSNSDIAALEVWQEPSLTTQHINVLRQDKAGARALALLQIGEKDLAGKELHSISGKPALQDALEALSVTVGLPVVVQPRQSKHAGRYPVMPWRPTGGFLSDPALVMAVAWNESRFEARAQSPSGARGIMQIMPDTAEHIAAGSSGGLFNAQANVTLGDLYIHKLSAMKGIDGNLLLLIAGYNCGPGKVQQLYADAQRNAVVGKDPLLFIETLPLKETRDYVQKVMATYAEYRLRLGKPLGAIATLSRGEWPSYEAIRTASK